MVLLTICLYIQNKHRQRSYKSASQQACLQQTIILDEDLNSKIEQIKKNKGELITQEHVEKCLTDGKHLWWGHVKRMERKKIP